MANATSPSTKVDGDSLGPVTVTAASGGVAITSLAQAYLNGAHQTVVTICATAIAGISAYVWKHYIELYLIERRVEPSEVYILYKQSRLTLIQMSKDKGTSRDRKKELQREIDDLDRVFSGSLRTQLMERMTGPPRDQEPPPNPQ